MTDTTIVSRKREELKRQLVAGGYTTLLDVMVATPSRIIQKLTRTPKWLPFWYGALVLVLINLVIGLLLSILLNELNTPQLLLFLYGTVFFYISLLLSKKLLNIFILHAHDHIIEAIISTQDLADLQHWLRLISNKKVTAILSITIGIWRFLVDIFLTRLSWRGSMFGIGLGIWSILNLIGLFSGLYVFALFFNLPVRLSHYRFELHAADPASSTLIHYLSAVFMSSSFLFALWAALGTLLTAATGLLDRFNILRLLGLWGITAALFALIQYSLSRIITTAKYKALSDVQSQIKQLWADEKLGDKETRDTLNWLMDYHDRIKATRNSALDVRAILSFVNSLLLPLVAFVLTNLQTIRALFP